MVAVVKSVMMCNIEIISLWTYSFLFTVNLSGIWIVALAPCGISSPFMLIVKQSWNCCWRSKVCTLEPTPHTEERIAAWGKWLKTNFEKSEIEKTKDRNFKTTCHCRLNYMENGFLLHKIYIYSITCLYIQILLTLYMKEPPLHIA